VREQGYQKNQGCSTMKRLQSTFQQYLKHIGRLEPVQLGHQERKFRPVTEEDNQLFIRLLQDELGAIQGYMKYHIAALLFMLILIASTGVWLGYKTFNAPTLAALLLLVSIALLLFVLERLRRIFEEKSVISATLSIIQDLPPNQNIQVVEVLYWSFLRKKRDS